LLTETFTVKSVVYTKKKASWKRKRKSTSYSPQRWQHVDS